MAASGRATRQCAGSGQNLGVRATAAEIPRHGPLDFIVGRMLVPQQQRLERKHLAGRAETALQCVVLDNCLLYGVQVVVRREPFDGSDSPPLTFDSEQQTAIHCLVIYEYSTRPALAHIAAGFRAGQVQIFAQGIQQSTARLNAERVGSAVDGQFRWYARRIGFLVL